MKMKNGMRVQIKIVFMLIALFLLTSCGKVASIADIDYANSGFAVGADDYVYYVKYAPSQADLYRYNIAGGEEYFVDNIYNSDTNVLGMIKMFNIDNRVFYGKSIKDGTAVYSIDSESSQPIFEGNINETLDAFNGEYSSYEFRMYKYADDVYVLAKNKLYKLNKENTEVVYDNISSLYIDDGKCYYSLTKDESSKLLPDDSSGLWCYDLKENKNTEIIGENVIEDYNSIETISGPICSVQNIIADDGQIYFLGAHDPTQISTFSTETGKIRDLTPEYRTRMFKKYGDKIYFIDVKHRLCSASVNNEDVNVIIQDSYVYSFNIYKDKIYCYKVADDRGHPSELVEFDMDQQTQKIICVNE
jgi:hypothetical protein